MNLVNLSFYNATLPSTKNLSSAYNETLEVAACETSGSKSASDYTIATVVNAQKSSSVVVSIYFESRTFLNTSAYTYPSKYCKLQVEQAQALQ